MPPLHSPSSPPRRVFKKCCIYSRGEQHVSYSFSSKQLWSGEKKKESSVSFRLVTPAQRRLSPGQLAPRSSRRCSEPGAALLRLRQTLAGRAALRRDITSHSCFPPLFIHNGSVELQPGLFAPSLLGRVEPVAGECLAAKRGKVLSHPESQPRCCLNFSASVQARRRVLLARR